MATNSNRQTVKGTGKGRGAYAFGVTSRIGLAFSASFGARTACTSAIAWVLRLACLGFNGSGRSNVQLLVMEQGKGHGVARVWRAWWAGKWFYHM
jgi:hypothetical protein